jgi:hypothetical protein
MLMVVLSVQIIREDRHYHTAAQLQVVIPKAKNNTIRCWSMADTNWPSSTVQSQHKVPHRFRRLSYQHTVHLLQLAALMFTTVAAGVVPLVIQTINTGARDDNRQHNSQIETADSTAHITVWYRTEFPEDGGSPFPCHTITYLMTILISKINDREGKGQKSFLTLYTVVPPYPRVIRSETYRGYVKPQVIPNAIYNVIFM